MREIIKYALMGFFVSVIMVKLAKFTSNSSVGGN